MSFSGGQAGLLPTGTPSTIEPNSWIEALDLATREPRPSTSASVSTIWLSRRQAPSPRRGNVSNKVESQVTQTTRRTYEKTEKMWIYTLRSIAPHGNYGSNQTDSHTPHSTIKKASQQSSLDIYWWHRATTWTSVDCIYLAIPASQCQWDFVILSDYVWCSGYSLLSLGTKLQWSSIVIIFCKNQSAFS